MHIQDSFHLLLYVTLSNPSPYPQLSNPFSDIDAHTPPLLNNPFLSQTTPDSLLYIPHSITKFSFRAIFF